MTNAANADPSVPAALKVVGHPLLQSNPFKTNSTVAEYVQMTGLFQAYAIILTVSRYIPEVTILRHQLRQSHWL